MSDFLPPLSFEFKDENRRKLFSWAAAQKGVPKIGGGHTCTFLTIPFAKLRGNVVRTFLGKSDFYWPLMLLAEQWQCSLYANVLFVQSSVPAMFLPFFCKPTGYKPTGSAFSDKRRCNKFFDFTFVCAFARACLRFGSHFREPEICVCLHLRAFVCVRLHLQTPPFITPPLRHPDFKFGQTFAAFSPIWRKITLKTFSALIN